MLSNTDTKVKTLVPYVSKKKQEPGGFKISASPYHQKKSLPKAKLYPPF